jgi:hypothetical protein
VNGAAATASHPSTSTGSGPAGSRHGACDACANRTTPSGQSGRRCTATRHVRYPAARSHVKGSSAPNTRTW